MDYSDHHIYWKNAINTAFAKNLIDKSVYEYMLENNKEKKLLKPEILFIYFKIIKMIKRVFKYYIIKNNFGSNSRYTVVISN